MKGDQEPDARPATTLHKLPIQLTSFVGRQSEIAALRKAIAGARLLTLTGTGGTGKTRLALELASALVSEYHDGTCLVELDSLREGQWVPSAVAAALDIREEPSRPIIETLVERLRPIELLLVLDNCEHVRVDCAALSKAILHSCQSVKVLATSRERLGLLGEVVHAVASLDVPEPEEDNFEAVAQAESVKLFCERAELSQPGFQLTAGNIKEVVGICRRLDGIPLAIELCAARVSVLSPQQILPRLKDRVAVLAHGSDTLPRHRTLQAAFDWSYELLVDAERALFRRLTVFTGTFTLEAAQSVCGGGLGGDAPFIDLLGQLADKSLVLVVHSDGGDPRYRLLDTLRHYGLDRLRESGEAEVMRRLHASYFLELAESRQGTIWVDRYREDQDNFRAALNWGQTLDSDFSVRMVATLGGIWATNGYTREAAGWLAEALERGGGDAATRGYAHYCAGLLAWYAGEAATAQKHSDQCMKAGLSLGNSHVLGHAHQLRAMVAGYRNELEMARREAADAVAIGRQLEDPILLVDALFTAAGVEMFCGNFDSARLLASEALVPTRQIGYGFGEALCLWILGLIALQLGDLQEGKDRLMESMRASLQIDAGWVVASALDSLAMLAWLQGNPERSLRLWGAGSAAYKLAGWVRGVPFQSMYAVLLQPARDAVGSETAQQLVNDGERMGLDRSIAYAMDV